MFLFNDSDTVKSESEEHLIPLPLISKKLARPYSTVRGAIVKEGYESKIAKVAGRVVGGSCGATTPIVNG